MAHSSRWTKKPVVKLFSKKSSNTLHMTNTEEQALVDAIKLHKDQKRKSGDPFVTHPIRVFNMLNEHTSIPSYVKVAGLLHDVMEEAPITNSDIINKYGLQVAFIVDAMTIKEYETKEGYWQRFGFNCLEDPWLAAVKLSDRNDNLADMDSFSEARKKRNIIDTRCNLIPTVRTVMSTFTEEQQIICNKMITEIELIIKNT